VSEAIVIRLEQPAQWWQWLLPRRIIVVDYGALRFLRFIQTLIYAGAPCNWKNGCPRHGLPAPRATARPVTGRRRDGR